MEFVEVGYYGKLFQCHSGCKEGEGAEVREFHVYVDVELEDPGREMVWMQWKLVHLFMNLMKIAVKATYR